MRAAREDKPDDCCYRWMELCAGGRALATRGRLDEHARALAVRDAWRELLDPTLARLG